MCNVQVLEYEDYHGIDSMAAFETAPRPLAGNREESASVQKSSDKLSVVDTDKLNGSRGDDSEQPPKSSKNSESKDEPMDTSETAPAPSTGGEDGKSVESSSKPITAAEATENKSASEPLSASDLRSCFWIADGGFTPLHSLWALEEKHVVKGKEYETWHRRHDFWLLCGTVMHGYRNWPDILGDVRLDILNRGFKNHEDRAKRAAFLNRRFQLLSHALVLEEHLMRAVEDYELDKVYVKKLSSSGEGKGKVAEEAADAGAKAKVAGSLSRSQRVQERDERLTMIDDFAADLSANSQGHKMVSFMMDPDVLQKGR